MAERTGGAGERVRDYVRWRRQAGRRPQTARQVVTTAALSGVVFTILMSLWDGLTEGWDEVTVGSVLFTLVFFTLFMTAAGFISRSMAKGQTAPGP